MILIERLDRLQPRLALTVVDLAQIQHVPIYRAIPDTRSFSAMLQ